MHILGRSLRKRGVDQSRDYVTLLSFCLTTARVSDHYSTWHLRPIIIIISCTARPLTTLRKWLMLNYECNLFGLISTLSSTIGHNLGSLDYIKLSLMLQYNKR